ncbi:GDP-L-fucose synthase [Bonamia ostreae]|uniref:GDP-L-fucose synthase n=1 Tax=Bonamia ostreae TaxID=126728 RepID=A0ABV2AM13_9EUKA
MIHNGPPHHSNETYSYAKRMIDVLNRAYNKQYGRKYISVIPVNIYGPHDNFNLEQAHVIPAIIHKCFLAKKNGDSLKLSGSGKPLRQFIYSEDLAILTLYIVQSYEETSPIILSDNENNEHSIKTAADIIRNNFSYNKEIKVL